MAYRTNSSVSSSFHPFFLGHTDRFVDDPRQTLPRLLSMLCRPLRRPLVLMLLDNDVGLLLGGAGVLVF